MVENLWNNHSKGVRVQVSFAGNNLYIFSFNSDSERDWVLHNSPWYILNKPLILRKWEYNTKRLQFNLSKIPLWVHLFNVLLELFSMEGLSYIASAIGNLLTMDSVTDSKSRLEFAKIYVEVGLIDEIPNSIEVILGNGQTTIVFVEVLWLPHNCKKCNKFGHTENDCLASKVSPPANLQIWRKKGESLPVVQPDLPGNSDSYQVPLSFNSLTKNENPLKEKESTKVTASSSMTPSDSTAKNDQPLTFPDSNEVCNTSKSSIPQIVSTISKPTAINDSPKPFPDSIEVCNTSKPPFPHTESSVEGHDNSLLGNVIKAPNVPKRERVRPNKVLHRAILYKVDVLCLLETRVKPKNFEDNIKLKFSNWNYYTNYDYASNGRIWFLWKKGLDLSFCQATAQSITVKGLRNGVPFFISAIYGYNDGSQRKQLCSDRYILGSYTSNEMKDFQDTIQDLLLQDHPFFEPTFTWINKQKKSYLARKLDKVLVNSYYVSSFHNSFVEFLAPWPSENCMALVWLNKDPHTNRPKPFKFFNFWTKHPNFLPEIQSSWQQSMQGNPMMYFFLKLKNLKTCLRNLNKDCYSNISARVKQKKTELEQIQLSTLNITSYIESKLIIQTLADLDKNITDEEIKNAFFSQGNDKAPGSDGYTPFFFKSTWSMVGEDVIKVVKYFFHNSFILPAFNSTIIALVPKITNHSKVKDYRPISCYSVVYKAITKILVKRLTNMLPKIITLNQTTFVKGRNIIDNTLLAQDLVKGYGKKSISPRCAIKIDLQKAFYSLDCGFISSILKAIELPHKFIAWIEACYSEARYSILFNGSLISYFKGERGLRQGDPLSPILFVLAMNILSKLLNLVVARGLFGQFLLPQAVINRINQLCSRYLWKGSDSSASGARVSWGMICSPKYEGGLGLKDLKSWNKVCMMQLIRNLLAGQGSLWIAWTHTYVIKSKDFNQMSTSASSSYTFNRLLKLKTEAIPILNAGVTNAKEIWEEIRIKHDKVPWHKLIWFPLHIPKFSIITWLAILDRLPTRERLLRMGITTASYCILRNNALETRNHLFVNCTIVTSIWNGILNLCHLSIPQMSWENKLAWASST
ncbi:uncharacterized protein LOC120213999 [Hibiscus syriacus]|uniref:uncharacterized protein LOC120213999 n=1 Tax=Hibiscus syriacus TaxID=106335 RepID=UPI001921D936|nr:uncharacterized protein LOC120213999 [Hibiscus syriacus]